MAKIGRPGINRKTLPQNLRNRATKTDPNTAEYLRQAAELINKQTNEIIQLKKLIHHYENDYEYEYEEMEVDA